MRRLRATFGLLVTLPFAAVLLPAHQVGTNSPDDKSSSYTLTLYSHLVIETVDVRDKKGNFIPGLSARDFHVTEDGMPQTVKLFEQQHVSTAAPLAPLPMDQQKIQLYAKLPHAEIAPGPRGGSTYQNRRLLALYFDMTSMLPQDQVRAVSAAIQFVQSKMSSADMLAVFRFNGGAVDLVQDFTSDRNRLLSILQTLRLGEGLGSAQDAGNADKGAAWGQDDAEFNLFNTDRQLSALQTAAHMLGRINEKKSLIYFAGDVHLNGAGNMAQLHATVDEAIRAGVTVWTVDARGLMATAPLGDATQGSAGDATDYNGAALQSVSERLQQSQDTLFSLASDTGGKALLDNNDLTRGIVQAQRAISDYYLIGYYSTRTQPDGRFRRIKIAADTPTPSELSYRRGYYAEKVFTQFNGVEKERQLEDALMLEDPITDLPIALEIDYFQLNRAEYFVPFTVKIPGRELALAKHGGAEHTLLDFICEVKDEGSGFTVANVRDAVNIKLTGATVAELAHRPILYDSGFTLLPGRYSIKFLARDDETGRIGTYQTTFAIPNLNKEAERVALSSVVIGSERADPKDAIYNAANSKNRVKLQAADPLVFDGKKLVPSVTRVFHQNRPIYLYVQAYLAAASPAPTTMSASAEHLTGKRWPRTESASAAPVLAYVSLAQKGKKALESETKAGLPLPASRLGVIPFQFVLNLSAVPPGIYQCQLTVLDPAHNHATFTIFPIRIVP